MEFQWDERNLRQILVDSLHGLTVALVREFGNRSPKLFPNRPGANRSGSHLMVGPAEDSRFWTTVLLELGGDVWRHITGWPSTGSETRLYSEAQDDQEA